MWERMNWLDFDTEQDYFAKVLKTGGFRPALIDQLWSDPLIKNKERGGSEHIRLVVIEV